MRKLIAAFGGICLLANAAFAQTATVGPLPPGNPAGMENADLHDPVILIAFGAGLVALIALAASNSGGIGASPANTGTG